MKLSVGVNIGGKVAITGSQGSNPQRECTESQLLAKTFMSPSGDVSPGKLFEICLGVLESRQLVRYSYPRPQPSQKRLGSQHSTQKSSVSAVSNNMQRASSPSPTTPVHGATLHRRLNGSPQLRILKIKDTHRCTHGSTVRSRSQCSAAPSDDESAQEAHPTIPKSLICSRARGGPSSPRSNRYFS